MGSQVWLINRIVDLLNLLIVRCLIMHFRNPSVPSRMDIKHSLTVYVFKTFYYRRIPSFFLFSFLRIIIVEYLCNRTNLRYNEKGYMYMDIMKFQGSIQYIYHLSMLQKNNIRELKLGYKSYH